MTGNIASMRQPYPDQPLEEQAMDADPIVQFRRWFQEAVEAEHVEPNAMTLATSTTEGLPSARMVLLKGVDAQGFIFYTNYHSRKGQELTANPRAALVFYWGRLARQVRVEGTVERVKETRADAYFATRPRDNQIATWASPQSQAVANREILEKRQAEYAAKFEGEDVPRPPHWGGFRVRPLRIEFWQGRPGRLHDRLRYVLQPNGKWIIERLAP